MRPQVCTIIEQSHEYIKLLLWIYNELIEWGTHKTTVLNLCISCCNFLLCTIFICEVIYFSIEHFCLRRYKKAGNKNKMGLGSGASYLGLLSTCHLSIDVHIWYVSMYVHMYTCRYMCVCMYVYMGHWWNLLAGAPFCFHPVYLCAWFSLSFHFSCQPLKTWEFSFTLGPGNASPVESSFVPSEKACWKVPLNRQQSPSSITLIHSLEFLPIPDLWSILEMPTHIHPACFHSLSGPLSLYMISPLFPIPHPLSPSSVHPSTSHDYFLPPLSKSQAPCLGPFLLFSLFGSVDYSMSIMYFMVQPLYVLGLVSNL